MADGAGPNGEARCTESSAATSNAVKPLVLTTPIFTTWPFFASTISSVVKIFGLFMGLLCGSPESDPRNDSAKVGWMRWCIPFRYVANGERAVLRDVWFPGLTDET